MQWLWVVHIHFPDAAVPGGSVAGEGEDSRQEGAREGGDGLDHGDGLELEQDIQLVRELTFNGDGKLEEHEENFQSSDDMMTF